jgi:hypothetical protein
MGEIYSGKLLNKNYSGRLIKKTKQCAEGGIKKVPNLLNEVARWKQSVFLL